MALMRFKYIDFIAALFLIGGMGIQFVEAYHRAAQRVEERLALEMEVAQEKLLFQLSDAYDAEYQLKDFIQDEMLDPDQLMEECYSILKVRPQFYALYVAYPPHAYPEKGKWYCPTSYRSGDTILSLIYGDAAHDYFLREWYEGALESDATGFWSQPYHDEDYNEPIFTYSNNVLDKDSNTVCIIGLDFSVGWLQGLLEQFKPFDDMVFALYNSNGQLLASSSSLGDRASSILKDERWVISRHSLHPLRIDMVMAVPKKYIWESIRLGILMPFAVFILGILVVGFLIRRLVREERENALLGTEKEVMGKELQIAHDIQMGILKGRRTQEDREKNAAGERDIDLDAVLLPMREVGGDLYDYHREGDSIWFIIGDVSGKGVPAAMVMSATVNLFRAIGRRNQTPKQIMEEMNFVLSENNPSMTFVTAFIGRLHIPSGELLYCNAGHCAPMIVKAKEHSAVSLQMEPNIPLGYDGGYAFAEQGCMLGEGEKIVLYTDGVTEARNSERRMLGRQRLSELVSEGRDLLAAVQHYIGDAEPTDDITLMSIRKRTGVQPLTMRMPNREDQWPEMRRTIHEYGICVGADKRTRKKIEIAAEEAVVNIMHHSGAGEIMMSIQQSVVSSQQSAVSRQQSAISITFIDDGKAFDPTAHETNVGALDERQVGGMGIALIRQIADEMHYERSEGQNKLTIIKKI